ncbi:MAG: FUSC family protein [Actinomycetota bacterium]
MLHLRRPNRSAWELGLRAAIGAGLALWIGTLIGLEDPYWGAVSAVVATAGTLGASLGAAVQRVAATTIALVIGLGFAALPVNGVVVSATAVGVTYLVMITLGLDAGARLAAASTLIVTAIPGTDALDLALSRGLNVPLGCLIAVGVGVVVFPHRASTALRTGLHAGLAQGAAVAAAAVRAYVGDGNGGDAGGSPETAGALAARVTRLEAAVASHRGVLRDAAREPGSARHLSGLEQLLSSDEELLDHARALVGLAMSGADDGAPVLVGDALNRVAEAIDAVVPALAPEDADGAAEMRAASGPDGLQTALAALDAAFAEVRRHRGTVEHSTEELTRLLSVIRRVHGVGAALASVAPGDPRTDLGEPGRTT